MLSKSNAKLRSLRDFLTIGEGIARNPIAENLAYLDSMEKLNNLIANEKTNDAYEKSNSSIISAQLFLKKNPEFDLLHLEVMAPNFMTIGDFLDKKVVVLKSVDLIYSIFALLYLGTQDGKNDFLKYIQNDKQRRELINLNNKSLYSLLYLNQIDALMVVSSSYGSPLAEDLLGIGTAIGHVKELIKDISYRSKFEKEQSKITLEKLQVDKMQSEATLTKMHIENKQALLEVEKMELENKQKKIEIVEKQLALYEKVKNQKISRKEKELITSAILIPVVQIAESEINPIALSSEFDHKKLLKEQNEDEGKKVLDEITKK